MLRIQILCYIFFKKTNIPFLLRVLNEINFLSNLFLKLDENSILHLHLDSMLISLQLFVIFFVSNFKDK
jgi:hypothetical protein